MYFFRNNKWKIIVVTVLVLAICASVFIVLWIEKQKKAEKYKTSMKKNWSLISDKAEAFASELNNVKSKSDLAGLKDIAVEFKETIDDVYEDVKDNPPPSSMKEIQEKQLDALESMSKYLDWMISLSSEEGIKELDDKKATLENRARKASEDFNELAAADDFNSQGISSDVFNGAKIISDAANNRSETNEAEIAAVYDALKVFMDADIKTLSGNVLWNMASSERRAGLEKLIGTSDKMLDYRNAQWGKNKPVGYYISRSSITFPSPGVAEAYVIAYIEKGISKKAKVQLILEPDGWKVSAYPFLGWVL